MTTTALRSGDAIPLSERAALPRTDKPIALADGRVLVCDRPMPNNPHGAPGTILGGSYWLGPRGLQVIVTLDNTDPFGPLLHVSVAYAKLSRWPSWADLIAVKDAIFGDVDCMMVLPKREDYVNVRENCFQIVQTPERWGIR